MDGMTIKSKTVIGISAVLTLCLIAIAAWQFLVLRKAHGSFENYYAFRGCAELLSRTDTSGICRTRSGDTIKIVEYRGKWYLDGDLPWCPFGACP